MVSIWPWKGGDTSAAAFEKTLSTLADKISKTATRSDKLHQYSRRYKGLFTLWTVLIYVLATLILTLITGWQNWGLLETGIIGGGPIFIYLGRTTITSYYTYRIDKTQRYLDFLHKERDDTVEKLKAATNYNSTQQLLEKYGAAKPTPPPELRPPSSYKEKEAELVPPPSRQGRTNLPPPPTANIPQNRQHSPAPSATPEMRSISPSQPFSAFPTDLQPTAEFAPNAFSSTDSQQYSLAQLAPPKWYDRVLDVLLGEDETQPKNRIVLLCSHCRLINGQAPPGTKRLEQIGRWRCGGCGGWNGVDESTETRKLLQRVAEQQHQVEKTHDGKSSLLAASGNSDSAEDEDDEDVVSSKELDVAKEEIPPARSTRSRTKARKKV